MLSETDPLQKLFSLFCPDYFERKELVTESEYRFVQYTSAQAAMSIIENQEVWLRNTQCMNDFSEVEHGIACLSEAFKSEEVGQIFKNSLEKLFPGIIEKFVKLFDSWIPYIRNDSYICCVSEHPPDEDKYGRLSMWRAYGGDRSIALVLNPGPFFRDSDAFHAYTYPVIYNDSEAFSNALLRIAEYINENSAFISTYDEKNIIGMLFHSFKTYALCVKHPGFKEEREWRIVYNPKLAASDHVKMEVQSINGVPQNIAKIPLKDIPEENFYGATIPQFIEQIIIGPNDHQIILGQAFSELLKNAGCENPDAKIKYSGIPLR